ncbi:hypothetical protein H9638_11650 [Arthrobacter sp. Sa2BUA2]|uniref:Uncharacterized protein n=1 Tax=Arthrobacter pullicola TaxID=2762224 RepID=A0ABR8YJQ6_9MICC|nr:hypothetical protein [Arthrobacter pullicola]MBD8044460.1 hypothetical protein [Arthrobacter pullicola]
MAQISGGGSTMVNSGQTERTRLRARIKDRVSPALAAQLLVPALLGLLGFCAVAAAVASTGGVLGITVTGLAVVVTLLLAAGAAPFYVPFLLAGTWYKPLGVLATVAAFHLLLFATIGRSVLMTVSAVPVALAGGGLLLLTSLWSQFHHGPAAEPVIGPAMPEDARPFTHTLVLVTVNWVFFAAAGMFSAWFLLGR